LSFVSRTKFWRCSLLSKTPYRVFAECSQSPEIRGGKKLGGVLPSSIYATGYYANTYIGRDPLLKAGWEISPDFHLISSDRVTYLYLPKVYFLMNPDTPIIKPARDFFQRVDFANSVAAVINNQNSEEGIVVGIYGPWGYGKTSVLNLIIPSVSNSKIVKFNPWRYENQDQILQHFFNSLSGALGNSGFTKKEDLLNLFKKYGRSLIPVTNFIPIVGGVAQAILSEVPNMIQDRTTEDYKNDIDRLLIEAEQNILIVIDDIDRLDDDEIFMLFKLIKLTGNFPYISYLLAFDPDVVTTAMGGRYSSNKSDADLNFLEKIVQLPLELPVIRQKSIKEYQYSLIHEACKGVDITLSEQDMYRFTTLFDANFLPYVKSPRQCVRYSNGLRFNMPVYEYEVNIVDVMILEALRIFFPLVYAKVKDNPKYFIFSNDDRMAKYASATDYKGTSKNIKELFLAYSQDEQTAIYNILSKLFPLYASNYNDQYNYEQNSSAWLVEKRVASKEYFFKYFSASIDPGDIPDKIFHEYIHRLSEFSVEKAQEQFELLLERYSTISFVQKIKALEHIIELESGKMLARTILVCAPRIEHTVSIWIPKFASPRGQALGFVRTIIERHEESERYNFAAELFNKVATISDGFHLLSHLRYGFQSEGTPFQEHRNLDLAWIIVNRLRAGCSFIDMISEYEHEMQYIMYIWSLKDKPSLHYEVESFLSKNPSHIELIVRLYAPLTSSTAHLEEYRGNFTKNSYEAMVEVLPMTSILQNVYSYLDQQQDDIPVYTITGLEIHQTNLNILRQFVARHEEFSEQ